MEGSKKFNDEREISSVIRENESEKPQEEKEIKETNDETKSIQENVMEEDSCMGKSPEFRKRKNRFKPFTPSETKDTDNNETNKMGDLNGTASNIPEENVVAAKPSASGPTPRRAPPKFKQRQSRQFKSKPPKKGVLGFGEDIPGMEGLGTDITVICPWEAFSHLELHELAQFGIL